MSTNSSSSARKQDKVFGSGLGVIPENEVVVNNEDDIYRWQKIAEMVPGKTVDEIKLHYKTFLEDIEGIESSTVALPGYDGSLENVNSSDFGAEAEQLGKRSKISSSRRKSSTSQSEPRKKGIAWTEQEHRLFLEGLEIYGRGDWRTISQQCVTSKTPTQVASHAQKYFMRLNSPASEKKRPSINDITDTGMGFEKLNLSPPVKTHTGKATNKEMNSSQALAFNPVDINNFVPPTIVQSSCDILPDFVAPTSAAQTAMETNENYMTYLDDFPDITTFP